MTRCLDPERAIAELCSSVPLGRIAVPEDIVDTMLYLASSQSRYVTGVVLEFTGAKAVHRGSAWWDGGNTTAAPEVTRKTNERSKT